MIAIASWVGLPAVPGPVPGPWAANTESTQHTPVAAVGALLTLAVPAERALALSLSNPGAAAAVQEGAKEIAGTTEVHWRHHRWHRWHHRHHHRHWRRW